MRIEKIVVGFLRTNCYLIINGNDCLVVDPGADYDIIKEQIGDFKILGVLITHHHPDHIGALDALTSNIKVPIYDYETGEGSVSVGPFSFDVINNNGHTNDSVTFYFKEDNIMFVGDFIFKGTIGRTDLPTGNDNEMRDSLRLRKEYNRDITIYPGHGLETTLGYEIDHNPYLKNI